MKYNNRETAYVLKHLPEWIRLYESGWSTTQLSDKYGIAPSSINKRLRKEGVLRSRSESKIGALNPLWKNGEVTKAALHQWLRRHLKEPEFCECCGVTPPRDLANISQEYKRDLNDWEWLCRKCHMTKDGRMNNLKQYAK